MSVNSRLKDLSPTFLNTRTTDKSFQQSGKQDSLRHLDFKSSASKKVQAHCSLEPPSEYNRNQMPLTNQGFLWPF